jgi:hypothetical protein
VAPASRLPLRGVVQFRHEDRDCPWLRKEVSGRADRPRSSGLFSVPHGRFLIVPRPHPPSPRRGLEGGEEAEVECRSTRHGRSVQTGTRAEIARPLGAGRSLSRKFRPRLRPPIEAPGAKLWSPNAGFAGALTSDAATARCGSPRTISRLKKVEGVQEKIAPSPSHTVFIILKRRTSLTSGIWWR